MRFAVSLVLLMAPTFSAQAQREGYTDLQRLTDDVYGYTDSDDDEERYENLVQVLSSRYDLNRVSEDELRLLNILSDAQIKNFIDYRNSTGTILDIHELQVIEAFDLPLISRLLPFVAVKDPAGSVGRPLLARIFSAGHSYFVSRYERTVETSRAFKAARGVPTPYSGSPGKLYLRFRSAQSGDYSMGFTAEKDAGEKLSFRPGAHPWGPDFNSFHLQLLNKGKVKNFILGDFQTQFAQGLLLGGAFGLGKGGETVLATQKSNVGFLPYTAVNETAFQRGLAVTLQPFSSIRVSGFYSHARRDGASWEPDDELRVRSFQASGLHRTAAELENRKRVTEQHYGLVVEVDKARVEAGVTIEATHFDIPVKRKPTLYNQFAFSGSQNLNTGFFFNYRFENLSCFGEVAQTYQGGRGAVAGLLLAAHAKLELAMLYRNYSRDFQALYANAFSENTEAMNERGIYWAWKYRCFRKAALTGYVDLFTFPWLAFRRYAPSHGYEWLLRLRYQPTRHVSAFLQFREEIKSRNLTGMTTLYRVSEGTRRNVTVHCDYGIGQKLRLKSRLQYSHYRVSQKHTEGLALVQDISLKTGRFKFTGRHALFDTDDYDNRQYVYEHDAWLAYSLPAYSGVGVRNYALIEYKVHRQLTIWARYARTRLLNVHEMGTAPDVIAGNTRNDLKFQVRFEF